MRILYDPHRSHVPHVQRRKLRSMLALFRRILNRRSQARNDSDPRAHSSSFCAPLSLLASNKDLAKNVLHLELFGSPLISSRPPPDHLVEAIVNMTSLKCLNTNFNICKSPEEQALLIDNLLNREAHLERLKIWTQLEMPRDSFPLSGLTSLEWNVCVVLGYSK